DVLARTASLNLGYGVNVYDDGTMNPEEPRGVQTLLQVPNLFADRMHVFSGMNANIVSRSRDPLYFRSAQKQQISLATHDQAVAVEARLTEKNSQLFLAICGRIQNSLLRPLHTGFEALTAERLQQVVNRPDLEGLDGVLVVSSHENYIRKRSLGQAFKNRKSI